MKRTLFVQDLKAKREFVWQCSLREDVSSFVTEKVGHLQWEVHKENKEFEKGEKVLVEGRSALVEDVYKTPFLLKERKLIASQENPIYKVRLGEGVVYVTQDRLEQDIPLAEAMKEFLQEEDYQMLNEFFTGLIGLIPPTESDILVEAVSGVQEKLDHVLESDNASILYTGIMEVLTEDTVEDFMSTLPSSRRNHLIRKLASHQVLLPKVTETSAKLGVTTDEMRLWESALGAEWQSTYMQWIEKGFNAAESIVFARRSKSPEDCAEMRAAQLSAEDFVHAQ